MRYGWSQHSRSVHKTKGGPNTKLAAVVDGLGRAVALNINRSNRHDIKALAPPITTMANRSVLSVRGIDLKFLGMNSHR
jgi:hypothetical protein